MKTNLAGLLKKLPPGPGSFPYVGIKQVIELTQNPLGGFMDYYREFGPVYTLRFMGIENILCIGPEANQHILVDNHRNFSWRDGFMGDLIPLLGDGLLTTDGEIHDRARALLMPVFKPARIRTYAAMMVERAVRSAQTLETGKDIEMAHWIRDLALTIAIDVLFGMKSDPELSAQFNENFERGLAYYGYPIHLQLFRGPGTPWQKMMAAKNKMNRILYKEIARRRQTGADGENIIDLLISAREEGHQLNDHEIRDHVMTLLFAGHDTTTATISWMFTLLGQNRHVYQKLEQEVTQTLGDRDPTVDDLIGGMPYLDQVIMETLRLYPAAWIGPRRSREPFELYGHTIPGGVNVAYSSWLSHRLPHVFPDPDAFDPERFTKEKIKLLKPGEYVPFGRGPRMCIGMRFGELEIKAIMAVLIRRFHFELSPGQDFRPQTVPTISPRFGVKMVAHSQSSKQQQA